MADAPNLRVPVYSQAKKAVGEVDLPEAIFAQPLRSHLLYETVKMQMANRRSGTASTKTRANVRGGGKKPWKQKGTGRARAGSSRSPIWVGGGTTFGPLPRDYSYRLPATARKKAICVALSAKQREGRLIVLDAIEIASGKTRDMVKALAGLEVKSALIVVAGRDEKLDRAARNVPGLKVVQVAGVNVYDLLDHEHVLLTTEALKGLGERLHPAESAPSGHGLASIAAGD